jgi:DNA-binding NarL/FixJ family response regulator
MQDDAAEPTAPEEPFAKDELWCCLTPRERQIACSLAEGRRNAEIAEELGLSVKTVDTHRGHILKKLGVPNNTKLAHLAIAHGWVVLQYATPITGN